MAAQSETELDRVWQALDSANAAIRDLERRVDKPQRQHAPTPDYRIGEAVAPVIDAQWPEADTSHGVAAPVEGPCSCEEAERLKARVAELEEQVDGACSGNLQNHERAESAEKRLRTASKAVDELTAALVEALRAKDDLEQKLAEATARASTAPASQADILCVESRIENEAMSEEYP